MQKYMSLIAVFSILGVALVTAIAVMNEFTDVDALDITLMTSGIAFCLGIGILIPAAYRWEMASAGHAQQREERHMLLGLLVILAAACLLASYSIAWAAGTGLPLLIAAIVWHGKRRPFAEYAESQGLGTIAPVLGLGFAAYMAGPEGSIWTSLQQLAMAYGSLAIGFGVVWAFSDDDAMLTKRMASE